MLIKVYSKKEHPKWIGCGLNEEIIIKTNKDKKIRVSRSKTSLTILEENEVKTIGCT
jgi:TolB-like protein